MTDPDPTMLASFLIDAGENGRTAQELVLTALSKDADALLDEIEALPPDYQAGVISALASLAGTYLALACGKDEERAGAYLRQQLFPGR
ncbi:hypothetical protein PUR61_16530 [Streptomyces sp. BE20]|uniref:hypothetical protein n=1 Tax=Streptomyces sp. BE20 TaxID=3002525 RepID=UPI002E78DC8C|nr:hypothetical protein [Streptomyces sp. BE20]MEE1823785.1 hypothetical protein [Streptomyces sp. BE20]